MNKKFIKRIAIALSLSNLCFFSVWHYVIFPPLKGYHISSPPSRISLIAILINVLILAALFLTFHTATQRSAKPLLINITRGSFLLTLLLVLHLIRVDLLGPVNIWKDNGVIGRLFVVLGAIVLAATIPYLILKGFSKIVAIAKAIVLMLAPFTLVIFAQAGYMIVKRGETQTAPPPSEKPVPQSKNENRIVWIIFDEMDYRVSFPDRPSSLKLPEFDRLRNESLFAENAYPPAGMTLQSMPALITGKLVAQARQVDYSKLELTFSNDKKTSYFGEQPNIFSKASSLGAVTNLFGWYHPYCRILEKDLDSCYFEWIENKFEAQSDDLAQNMLFNFKKVGSELPGIRQHLLRKNKLVNSFEYRSTAVLKQIIARGTNAATKNDFSLTLIHLPLPHSPYIYSRKKKEITYNRDSNYFDNLIFADKVLGNIRKAMEKAGVWDSSTVLISSDHWWRLDEKYNLENYTWSKEELKIMAKGIDRHIPFILKLKNQKTGSIYKNTFNTVLANELLLDLMQDKIKNSDEVFQWIDKRKTIGERE